MLSQTVDVNFLRELISFEKLGNSKNKTSRKIFHTNEQLESASA